MISDTQVQHLYFADTLQVQFPNELKTIRDSLKPFTEIKIDIIKGTKDIWTRDYMPVHVGNEKYVSFRYQPWYLKGYEQQLTSRFDLPILKSLDVQYSDINLDGGNVEQSATKVILTDRIYEENKNLSKEYLLEELKCLFKKEVIIVKAYKKSEDMTGHIDGMMRFVNESTLLVNSLNDDDDLKKDLQGLKRDYGLNYIELPYFDDPFNSDKNVPAAKRISARGIYVNYLAIDNAILFPIFEMKGFVEYDEQAIETISDVFPHKEIVPININEIAIQGGLMNCISWRVNK
jgi:agmatine deiminase